MLNNASKSATSKHLPFNLSDGVFGSFPSKSEETTLQVVAHNDFPASAISNSVGFGNVTNDDGITTEMKCVT
jgi:hypothetical protein